LGAWVWVQQGASLGAPADPAEEYAAARPEWFFLWLFQLLKYFKGGAEVWGAVVLPLGVLCLLALAPWFAVSKIGHRWNQTLVVSLVCGVVVLTLLAQREDRADQVYVDALREARTAAERVQTMAADAGGLPPGGARAMMASSSALQGPKLFAQHCAGCHRYNGHNGLGEPLLDPPTAPDLYQFASRDWLAGLLDPETVDGPRYFGGTRFKTGKMVRFVKRDVAEFDEELLGMLRKVVVALSAEAELPGQVELDRDAAEEVKEGRVLLDDLDMRCSECHRFHEYGEETSGPDLTGYGSRDWTIAFVRDASHQRFYGERNDRMPRFGAENLLTDQEIELIVDWLRAGLP
jgi:ubiquinol-cytochrome c reductase cytochrome b subunit